MTETPPPPELMKLFEAEKAAPAVNTAARAALRTRLVASVGHLPLGGAATSALLGGAGKAIVVLVLAIGAGTAAVAYHREVSASPTSVSAAPAIPTQPPTPRAAPAEVALTPVVPAPAPVVGAARVTRAVPVSQAAVLEKAWRALAANEPARVLELVREDARLHPDGVLDEERDALQIVALAKLERSGDARSAASHFYQTYPESVHRALIERALAKESSP